MEADCVSHRESDNEGRGPLKMKNFDVCLSGFGDEITKEVKLHVFLNLHILSNSAINK
jgi:hypothetical protein